MFVPASAHHTRHIAGFAARLTEPVLSNTNVPTDMREANSDWVLKAVVGNLIDPDAAMQFNADCAMFEASNSKAYAKGIRDGRHDGELVRDGESPINFLAAEILVT